MSIRLLTLVEVLFQIGKGCAQIHKDLKGLDLKPENKLESA